MYGDICAILKNVAFTLLRFTQHDRLLYKMQQLIAETDQCECYSRKTDVAPFWSTFAHKLGYFYSYIWSHWAAASHNSCFT